MTEYEKMISGAMYNSSDKALVDRRLLARKYCRLFNTDPWMLLLMNLPKIRWHQREKDAGNCFGH